MFTDCLDLWDFGGPGVAAGENPQRSARSSPGLLRGSGGAEETQAAAQKNARPGLLAAPDA